MNWKKCLIRGISSLHTPRVCLTSPTNFSVKNVLFRSWSPKQPVLSSLLGSAWNPVIVPAASFKRHVGVHLRCPDCRFTRIDNRLAVLCKTHPRHKQIQQGNEKSKRVHKPYLWRWPDPFDKKYLNNRHEDRYVKAFEN